MLLHAKFQLSPSLSLGAMGSPRVHISLFDFYCKNKLRARLSSYGAFHEGCGGWGFGKKTENFENAFLTFQTGLGAVHSHVLVDGEGRQSTGIQRSS